MRTENTKKSDKNKLSRAINFLGFAGFILLSIGLFSLNYKWAMVIDGGIMLTASIYCAIIHGDD